MIVALSDRIHRSGSIPTYVNCLLTVYSEAHRLQNAQYELIASLQKPTLFGMEGGYAVDAIGVNVVNVLNVLNVLKGFEN